MLHDARYFYAFLVIQEDSFPLFESSSIRTHSRRQAYTPSTALSHIRDLTHTHLYARERQVSSLYKLRWLCMHARYVSAYVRTDVVSTSATVRNLAAGLHFEYQLHDPVDPMRLDVQIGLPCRCMDLTVRVATRVQ